MQRLIVVSLLLLMQNLRRTEGNPLDVPLLVIKITRHGARTPTYYPPGDPNNDLWHEAAGQLTNEGKNELYDIGQSFGSEYSGYLNEFYKPEEIKTFSTDVDRTLMSAQTFLAGLYPPSDYQVWKHNIAWQPIPVHVLPYDLTAATKNGSIAMFSQCHGSNEDDFFFNQNKDLIELIQAATGIYYTSCYNFNFFMILDTFTVEKFYGRTLPFGLDSHFEAIQTLKNDYMVRLFAAPPMAIASNAQLYQDLGTMLQDKASNVSTYKAIPLFMHDTHVLAFLSTLVDNYPLTSPEFAASILIELVKTTILGEESLRVKVYHIPAPLEAREHLRINGCGFTCSLDEFQEQLRIASIPQTSPVCPCYA